MPVADLESVLLARSLKPVGDYEYYDYNPSYARFELDDLNRDTRAKDLFSSMSVHLVLENRHVISVFQLYSLRTPGSGNNKSELVDIAVKLHGWDPAFLLKKTETIGNITVFDVLGEGFHLWLWTDAGILYTVWDLTYTGNEAYPSDFVAAYVSRQQGLALPEPTAKTPPGNKSLATEDESLLERLVAVDDFFYVDMPYEEAVWFYNSFKGVPNLERGSGHVVVDGRDLVRSDYSETLGFLQLLELKTSVKTNPKTIKALIAALVKSVASGEDRLEVTTTVIGGVTVSLVRHLDWDVETMAYVWEQGGVTYLLDGNPMCTGTCEGNIRLFVEGLINSTTALLAAAATTTTSA